jgi:hypothetical protein
VRAPKYYTAHVVREPGYDAMRLFLWGGISREYSECLCEDGTWVQVPTGEKQPANAGILLPIDAWAAIAAEVHPPEDITNLKAALEVERTRVNHVLESFLNGRLFNSPKLTP